jgi:hypothetical protein
MVTWLNASARTRRQIADAVTRVFTRSDRARRLTRSAGGAGIHAPAGGSAGPPRGRHHFRNGCCVQGLAGRCARHAAAAAGEGPGPCHGYDWPVSQKPLTILVVGINGSGKTTTCAKLGPPGARGRASSVAGAGRHVPRGGPDQLRIWAERVGCEAVVGKTGADAAAVAYDALEAAAARDCDVVLIDTAGRMHTKQPSDGGTGQGPSRPRQARAGGAA